MPQQKLDLLEVAAILPAELGAGAAQVVGPEPLDPDLFGDCSTTDQTAQSLMLSLDLAALGHRPQQPAVFDSGGGHPGVDSLLDPYRDRHGADPAPFPFEIDQHPAALPQLDRIDIERGELLPAQGAADQKRQDHVIPLALERRPIGNGQQLLRLLPGQPVPQPGSLLGDVGNLGQVRGLFRPDHAVLAGPRRPVLRTAESRTLTVEGESASIGRPVLHQQSTGERPAGQRRRRGHRGPWRSSGANSGRRRSPGPSGAASAGLLRGRIRANQGPQSQNPRKWAKSPCGDYTYDNRHCRRG